MKLSRENRDTVDEELGVVDVSSNKRNEEGNNYIFNTIRYRILV